MRFLFQTTFTPQKPLAKTFDEINRKMKAASPIYVTKNRNECF